VPIEGVSILACTTGQLLVTPGIDGPAAGRPNLVMWAGSVVFAEKPEADRFRLLVEEHESVAPGEAIVTGFLAAA
jgi:hypothetical protein